MTHAIELGARLERAEAELKTAREQLDLFRAASEAAELRIVELKGELARLRDVVEIHLPFMHYDWRRAEIRAVLDSTTSAVSADSGELSSVRAELARLRETALHSERQGVILLHAFEKAIACWDCGATTSAILRDGAGDAYRSALDSTPAEPASPVPCRECGQRVLDPHGDLKRSVCRRCEHAEPVRETFDPDAVRALLVDVEKHGTHAACRLARAVRVSERKP